PYEMEVFNEYLRQKSSTKDFKENANNYGFDLEWILEYIISLNVFALSWTRKDESDALWRIYSDNNQSVRIAVKEEILHDIDDCVLCDVKYVDFIDFTTQDDFLNSSFYELFSAKRTAFEH